MEGCALKRHIIALGGGKLRAEPDNPETLVIDQRIVEASGGRRPRLLFVPTASTDDAEYCAAVDRHFGRRLGCEVDHLLLLREPRSHAGAAGRIAAADIIYVGGGNTLRMMKLWRRLGLDQALDGARERGAVLCGLSAGAICWFRQGNSDSRNYSNPGDPTLIKVRGLGFVDLLMCPHYDTERHRQPALDAMMQKTPGVAVALENNAALEIRDSRYRILVSQPGKQAFRVSALQGRVRREPLPVAEDWLPLAPLLDPASPVT